MCIRDSHTRIPALIGTAGAAIRFRPTRPRTDFIARFRAGRPCASPRAWHAMPHQSAEAWRSHRNTSGTCLLYTSDAADDLTRVDLGGRRIIKKKKKKKHK